MIIIAIASHAGHFAENKDIAHNIREKTLLPALENSEDITIDFTDVDGATQSFVHALISEPIRRFGGGVLDHIYFKNCNDTIQKIITIVTDYLQESA